LLGIGGVEDHVHLLVQWRTDGAASDLMRAVKARSSKWVRAEFPALGGFAWQEGYGVFTVSASQEAGVMTYLARQREHHAREGFSEELVRVLRAHGVEFEERFVGE